MAQRSEIPQTVGLPVRACEVSILHRPWTRFHKRVCLAAAFTTMLACALAGCREKGQDASDTHPIQKPALTERSEDLRALIATALDAGSKRLVIPPGRYRVQAERGGHLVFSNLTDVEIVAENVEMLCTSTVRAVLFEGCTNVTLRGLVVDYDPLPFTQA